MTFDLLDLQTASDRSAPSRGGRLRRAAYALLFACLGATRVVSAAPIAADAAAAGPVAPATAGELQEVVVTAEKRDSTVQKTPISITAISGSELQAAGVSDMLTVAQEVPGISFKSAGPGQTEFEIRGLTSTGGESPTVGFYLDDVALTPAAMAQNGKTVIDPSLFDLNRVEVLRGPQGTLYGSSSMGGTIKLVTNQPDPHAFASNVEVIGSGTESGGGFNHTENLMVNLPLVPDYVALRVVGTDKNLSGWIDRDVLNPFPPRSTAAVRAATSRGRRLRSNSRSRTGKRCARDGRNYS